MNKFFQPGTFSESSAVSFKQQYNRDISMKVSAPKANNHIGMSGNSLNHNARMPEQTTDTLAIIAPFLEKVSCVAGEYIHQPNDQINYIYFPETAVISEFEILKDGRAVGVSLHGNESVIGLSSIFDEHPADNWTQVLLSGSAYKIKSEIFKAKLLQHQTLQVSVFEHVNSHIKQLTQRIVCNSYHTIEERLCALLLTLQGYRKNNSLLITQEQIAHFLGTHRPSITQATLNLRAREVINYVRKNVTILDFAKLKNLACDCYLQ